MPRLRVFVEPVADDAPDELMDPFAKVWSTADTARVWLERHGLRRRLRADADLVAMTPAERCTHAASAWAVREARRG
ncbi:MAG TPA: hypothetical protein VGM94_17465 [Galbitalea sp.]